MFDTINLENLEKFIDTFYNKVRKDKNIGPTFNARMGDSEKGWERHKAVVSSFWLYQLTGIRNEGAPRRHKDGSVGAHIALPPFPREHFSVWLRLFEETLSELFDEKCKNEILASAKEISAHMQGVLYEGKEWIRPNDNS